MHVANPTSVFFALVASLHTTTALPGAVGNCAAGNEALLQTNNIPDVQTHGILNQVGGGPLSDYNLTLTLDGIALDPSTPMDFIVGVDHVLSLSSDGNPFKGFLMRMESSDEARTLNAIVPREMQVGDLNETIVLAKTASECQAGLLAGVSHIDPLPKTQVDTTLNMESLSTGLELDVTIVVETSIARNISHWYYSRYFLNSIRDPAEPTASPTTLLPTTTPSQAPSESSDMPTSSPVASGVAGQAQRWLVLGLCCVMTILL